MSKLYRARSLLYRRQILQVNIPWKALDEIYKIYRLLHRSDLKISEIFRQFFSPFFGKICKNSVYQIPSTDQQISGTKRVLERAVRELEQHGEAAPTVRKGAARPVAPRFQRCASVPARVERREQAHLRVLLGLESLRTNPERT